MSSSRPGSLADATGKLASRRRQRQRRRTAWIVAGLGVGALGALVVWLVWFSGVLTVSGVRVEGVSLLGADEVERAAQVPLGQPVASVEVGPIEERVAALPPVASAQVSVSWSGEVLIKVSERVAAFQRLDAETYTWVDAEGVQFRQTAEPDASLVTVVSAAPDERLYRDIATVVGALSAPIRERLVRLEADSPDRIVLRLSGESELVWGSADESGLKSQVATALIQIEAKTYDVSAPNLPITRR
ncbi:MAG: FtsQ-type POTRA domain-containing protein [Propionibacteriaceae bacterium]|nr:FtsQ-type POTRA domain-containing protein [Propionibacteriaceae bacterium]